MEFPRAWFRHANSVETAQAPLPYESLFGRTHIGRALLRNSRSSRRRLAVSQIGEPSFEKPPEPKGLRDVYEQQRLSSAKTRFKTNAF